MPEPAIPALARGTVAAITGAASGIGLAAAKRFAGMGLKLALADRDAAALDSAAADLALTGASVRAAAVDVARFEDVQRFAQEAAALGRVSVLMNNAGAGQNPGKPWENLDGWKRLLAINLWGIVHGVQAFAPAMIASGATGLIINTGSKQGITLPPGNAAYNVSKAGVKAYTELLAHELRNAPGCRVSAHLLIPGFTFTGMAARSGREKPAAAWTAEQVVDFMLDSLARGDFYILCPDNDVPRALDEKRVAWMAGDLIENRPALSRWHDDYKDAFAKFVA
jgi:NAD(P)-dependent dehydrogenase (short-subunit alcohol dehydrogenase family)